MLKVVGKNLIVPFVLDVEDEGRPALARVGGRGPAGLAPDHEDGRYLITLPIDHATYVSVFTTRDDDYYLNNTSVLSLANDAFEVFFHAFLPRRSDSLFASDLSGHALKFEREQVDSDVDGDGLRSPSSRNKIGGEPYLLSRSRDRVLLATTVRNQGFVQLVQLDLLTLGTRDVDFTEGESPFGDGLFHFFVKPPAFREWCCFWEL